MKRILYVEDSVTSQRIFQRMFNPPCDVVLAASPKAALAYLEKNRVDLVVTDCLFGAGDAFEVLGAIRQRSSLLALPVIAVSSSMDQALTSRLLHSGANACAAKPLHNADFRALVEGMLADPFVARDDTGVVSAACFQWYEKGHFHEYCPETGDHLTGTSRAEVAGRMQALLQERWARGADFGHVSQERTLSYVLRQEPVPAE